MPAKPDIEAGKSRSIWRRRAARWLGIAAGTLAVSATTGVMPAPAATEADSKSTAVVPAIWQDFAKRLQIQIQQRLASDGEAALRFRDTMARLAAADASSPPPSVIVRVWVVPDGKVEHIEMEGAHGEETARDLSSLLIGSGADRTPEDMPQPLRMRLSLPPKSGKEN